jgi:hypothetical protein
VVSKHVEPEREYVSLVPIPQYTTICNKDGCTSQFTHFLLFPYWIHDDQDWVLIIQNEDGRQTWLDVEQDVYDRVSVGDFYSTNKPRTTDDREVTPCEDCEVAN